ncbi:MAG: 30S ribosomal protein S4 [Actinobacteria bacterium]|nr:30S ribosomal protein S4 [Actinomycetota bacterium]
MARNVGPQCRLCRREGIKLFLKGVRCDTAKCPIERQGHNNPPGMHGWRRSRGTSYGIRLREKQKVKRYYGVLEKQFRIYFARASKQKQNTGAALLSFLERRLDNAVFRSGFTVSRRASRQLVNHGHIYVNDHKVDVASYLVKPGDFITVKDSEKSLKQVREQVDANKGRQLPGWLSLDEKTPKVTILAMPTRDDVQIPVEEHLIVELCSM